MKKNGVIDCDEAVFLWLALRVSLIARSLISCSNLDPSLRWDDGCLC
ncbi:hypothetical protein ACVW0Y_004008 [Pseudomonas sp. TE3786]